MADRIARFRRRVLPLLLPRAVLGLPLKPLSAGAPERIRTPNPQIRSLVLYPVELRAPRCKVQAALYPTRRAAASAEAAQPLAAISSPIASAIFSGEVSIPKWVR
jgi:hypothetical protein